MGTWNQASCDQKTQPSALSCLNMWNSNYPHRHVNAIALHIFVAATVKLQEFVMREPDFSPSAQGSNRQHQLKLSSLYPSFEWIMKKTKSGPFYETPCISHDVRNAEFTEEHITTFAKRMITRISQISLTQAELWPILSLISLRWKRVRSGENANGSIRWPIPENPPIDAKSCQNLIHKSSYSQFCPKFRCHGNGGLSGENAIGSNRWRISVIPLLTKKSCRILLHKPSYSQFCLKFRCNGNGNRWGKLHYSSI